MIRDCVTALALLVVAAITVASEALDARRRKRAAARLAEHERLTAAEHDDLPRCTYPISRLPIAEVEAVFRRAGWKLDAKQMGRYAWIVGIRTPVGTVKVFEAPSLLDGVDMALDMAVQQVPREIGRA